MTKPLLSIYLFAGFNLLIVAALGVMISSINIYYVLGYFFIANLILIILTKKNSYLHLKNPAFIATLENKLKIYTEKNNLLSTVLNNLDMAVWVRNKKLAIIYFNKKYAEIALNDNTAIDSTNFEIDKFAKNTASNALSKQGIACWEERYLIIKGKRYLYQFIDLALSNSDIIVCSSYDVSSKDNIDKELQQNIQAQADLLESTSNASAIFNKDRKLKFFNQAFVKLWGLSEQFLESYPFYENILDKLYSLRKLPEQANYSKFRKEQLKLFTNLTSTFNEFFHLPDGRSVRVIVIPYSLGNIIFSYEDMTDHLALQSSYNSLVGVQRATLSNLHEALCVFGENGRLTLYNPKFALLWNLNTEFLNSSPLLPALFEEYKDLFTAATYEEYKQKMISGYIRRKKFIEIIERKDGIFINRIMVPLPDGATLISDLDITASVIAERALLEKNKALQDADRIKTEFLTNVSYELRSPLTSIMGYAEIINRQYVGKLNIKQQNYINHILNSSKNLANIIDDVMDLTLAEAGKIELEYVQFELIETISEVVANISKAKFHQINIHNEDKQDHYIKGDEKRFKQIIFKLLCNAIEYSENSQDIDVTVKSNDLYCCITITDHGKGIPKEEQKLIFNKFYQASNTKLLGRSGTGLGLPIVKKLVELHKGSVEFTSEAKEGSSFTIKLPIKY